MIKDDGDLSIDVLKDWVKKFCEERNWDPYHGPKDLAIGLVTESCELLEIFRFQDEGRSRELLLDRSNRQKVADELADSLYFILRFSQMYGFDLSQCLSDKLKKNATKYPVK